MTEEVAMPELPPLPEPKLYPSGTYPDGVLTYSADQMHAYARERDSMWQARLEEAVRAAKEECAKVAEQWTVKRPNNWNEVGQTTTAAAIATAIRAKE